jgi:3-oxoacyl-[acyl-carrier-protein] synthase II
MSVRRVAVTGLGMVSPLGNTVAESWSTAIAGRSAAGPITQFDASAHAVTFAAEVRDFETEPWVSAKDVKKMDRALLFAVVAGLQAWEDSGLDMDRLNPDRVGVFVGSGVGGMRSLEDGTLTIAESGPRRLSPFIIPKIIINLCSGQLSIRLGARGPNFSHVSACATGNHSIGEAARAIRHGYADVMIAGGAEAAITPLSVGGFARMGALSRRNDEPQRASRPFDAGRDGFVIGEGAGVLVLEEWEAARARGAHILAEVAGYGANADAFHMTQPAPEGRGAATCMRLALEDAGVAADRVGYINAHGTSTPFNDSSETSAIRTVFGSHADRLVVSSTKSMHGHALGAAGGLEAVLSIQALGTGIVPPTINLEEPDPDCDLDYCANEARQVDPQVVLSNAFGFGGTNACLVMAKP